MTKYPNTIKYVSAAVALISLALPLSSAFAYVIFPENSTPQTMVCGTLQQVGMAGCDPRSATNLNYQPKQVRLNFDIFGSSSATTTPTPVDNGLVNATAGANVKDIAGNAITLVQVPGDVNIYALVAGQKHLIPTFTIFIAYGYTMAMVQPITHQQLDKYPRADLVKVHGSSKLYYLTEGNMTRLIPNQKIFDSYGDRKENVIEISAKEFNYYPVNQYVYQENPLNRDVFQLTSNGKRYLTPMAVYRLQLREDQVAPINQAELDYYKTLAPILN